jgi:hypothetical protein
MPTLYKVVTSRMKFCCEMFNYYAIKKGPEAPLNTLKQMRYAKTSFTLSAASLSRIAE